jgi:hypothetical protein
MYRKSCDHAQEHKVKMNFPTMRMPPAQNKSKSWLSQEAHTAQGSRKIMADSTQQLRWVTSYKPHLLQFYVEGVAIPTLRGGHQSLEDQLSEVMEPGFNS